MGALDARNEHLRVENESLKRKADNKSHEDTRAIERKLVDVSLVRGRQRTRQIS